MPYANLTISGTTNEDGTRNRRTTKRDLLKADALWREYGSEKKVRIVRVHRHHVVVEFESGRVETYLTTAFTGRFTPFGRRDQVVT